MHVAITGASSGIGAAIASQFAAKGASVTVIARREARLRELVADMPSSHVAVADLSTPETCTDWIPAAEAALGPIDVLINNAGIQIVDRTEKVTPEAGEKLLRLNVLSPFRLIHAVLPAMLERNSGSIVNIASLAAIAPTPGMFHYSASKAALGAASETLAGETRKTGVHVMTVYPGPVKTDMADAAMDRYGEDAAQIRRMPTGDTATLARLIYEGVEANRARIVYPAVYLTAKWFPGTTRWVMDRFTPLPG
ncbi:MAG: short-subunit dehydrogenase [Myxococcota bacterium]|jgi:short-subunit dehydrogenase